MKKLLSISVLTLVFVVTKKLYASDFTENTIVNQVDQLGFYNFNQYVSLIPFTRATTNNNPAMRYQIKGTVAEVYLSGELVVKTTNQITKQQLSQFHADIDLITTLYQGYDFSYFLVRPKRAKGIEQVVFPVALFEQFLAKSQVTSSGITLVQPDILQVKTKTSLEKNERASTAPYFSMLNIDKLWKETKGEGVNIAVIDDGIELSHPDLVHIIPTFSFDIETQQTTAKPQSPIDKHGTKVAGIIFAAHNQQGIDGIAPEANLIAIRQPDTWTSKTLLSFQVAKLSHADIINCSWHSNFLLQPLQDVVNDLAKYGRSGKGTAVIWAAGNKGQELKENQHEASIDRAITVGAIDRHYTKTKYSNFGQQIDLYNYGEVVPTAIVKNRAGKEYGYFSGTSLAAAITSGLAALLLAKQPELTLAQLTEKLRVIVSSQQTVK